MSAFSQPKLVPLHTTTNIYLKLKRCEINVHKLAAALHLIDKRFYHSYHAQDLKKEIIKHQWLLKQFKRDIAEFEQLTFPFGG